MTNQKEDYNLWLIEFFVQKTKEHMDGLESGLEKLQNRATALFGWTVTLSIASLTACGTGIAKNILPLAIIAGLVSILLTLTAICCVIVLYTKKWKYLEYTTEDIKDFDKGSKIETLKTELVAQNYVIKKNIEYYKRTRRFIRLAWILFTSTPVLLITSGIIYLSSL